MLKTHQRKCFRNISRLGILSIRDRTANLEWIVSTHGYRLKQVGMSDSELAVIVLGYLQSMGQFRIMGSSGSPTDLFYHGY